MLTGTLASPEIQQYLTGPKARSASVGVVLFEVDDRPRSAEQNQYFIKICRAFAQQHGGSVAAWHKALALRFLGHVEGVSPDGDVRRIPASTSALSMAEFTGFLEACIAYADECKVQIHATKMST